MLIYGNKTYNNIQEQVEQNMRDIKELKKRGEGAVVVNPILTEGTHIANIIVGEEINELYAPNGGGEIDPETDLVVKSLTAQALSDGTTTKTMAEILEDSTNVEVEAELDEGTKIATITVDEEPVVLYAPDPTEVTVTAIQTEGDKIASIKIDDDDPIDIYAPKEWPDEAVEALQKVLEVTEYTDQAAGLTRSAGLMAALEGSFVTPTKYTVVNKLTGYTSHLKYRILDLTAKQYITLGAQVYAGNKLLITKWALDDGYELESGNVSEGTLLTVNADVEIKGNVKESESPEPEPEYTEVELTNNPITNDMLLETALKGDKDVKITSVGRFPISSSIVVKSKKLDLQGAEIYCDQNIDLVVLEGSRPVLIGGTLSGNYVKGKGEEGYIPIEDGTTPAAVGIRIGDCSDYEIKDMHFTKIAGYCITAGSLGLRQFSPSIAPADGYARYNLSGKRYISARSGQGNTHYISNGDITYKFSNGVILREAPGKYIEVPSGATYVDVKLDGPYVLYCLFESDYTHTGSIHDCDFICNQRLGIANIPSACEIYNCTSDSNGYAHQGDHTGVAWDSSTSGFCDLEDTQPDTIHFYNCSSKNENLGIASGAYQLYVDDCDLDVRPYHGWYVWVSDCKSLTYNSADAAWDMDIDIIRTPVNDWIINDTVSRDSNLNNIPVLPVSPAVYNCPNIDIYDTKTVWYGKAANGGVIKNATINLYADWLVSRAGINLTFENCTFKNPGKHLILKQLSFEDAQITCKNCTLEGMDNPRDMIDDTLCPVLFTWVDDNTPYSKQEIDERFNNIEDLIGDIQTALDEIIGG